MSDFNLSLPSMTNYLNKIGLNGKLPSNVPTHNLGNQIDQIFLN